jgi:flavodoxin
MKIAIVFDSSTGTTRQAAQAMGATFEELGHQCQVQRVVEADPAKVAQADLICIGSWVQGWFIIKQHPTKSSLAFIDKMGDLIGKEVVVFCTYKIAAGSTLKQMAQALEAKGARVTAMFKYRGPDPDDKFEAFARSLK